MEEREGGRGGGERDRERCTTGWGQLWVGGAALELGGWGGGEKGVGIGGGEELVV